MDEFWIFVIFVFYFWPALTGFKRRHKNAVPILILNFFLGWTILGWIGAFIWSHTSNIKS